MSGMTVEPTELKDVADYRDQAAAAAAKGVDATESVDLKGKLYLTHGPISGPSNDAISAKARVREDAGRALQEACLTLAAALTTAATWYTDNDASAAGSLNKQMQG